MLVVEVTSDSTEAYDRGAKVALYQGLPSLREILLVSHRAPELLLHRCHDDGAWEVTRAQAGESVDLTGIGVRLAVDEVYRDGIEDDG